MGQKVSPWSSASLFLPIFFCIYLCLTVFVSVFCTIFQHVSRGRYTPAPQAVNGPLMGLNLFLNSCTLTFILASSPRVIIRCKFCPSPSHPIKCCINVQFLLSKNNGFFSKTNQMRRTHAPQLFKYVFEEKETLTGNNFLYILFLISKNYISCYNSGLFKPNVLLLSLCRKKGWDGKCTNLLLIVLIESIFEDLNTLSIT